MNIIKVAYYYDQPNKHIMVKKDSPIIRQWLKKAEEVRQLKQEYSQEIEKHIKMLDQAISTCQSSLTNKRILKSFFNIDARTQQHIQLLQEEKSFYKQMLDDYLRHWELFADSELRFLLEKVLKENNFTLTETAFDNSGMVTDTWTKVSDSQKI